MEKIEDKLRIALKLDEFGIDYIEGGWPYANPKDNLFFQKMKEIKLTRAKNSRGRSWWLLVPPEERGAVWTGTDR